MIKLISLPIILLGLIIIYRSFKVKKSPLVIEEISLEELSKIWVDEKIKEEVKEEREVAVPVAAQKIDYDEVTGEVYADESTLLERFFNELMKLINIVDDGGRCGAFTLFDTDNLFVSQKQMSNIAESLAITEEEILADLEREGYINSGYKLYKVHYRNQSKPLIYKSLNLKLFCTEDIERRKDKRFMITNIEEVKTV